jgi:NADH dehydrogenase
MNDRSAPLRIVIVGGGFGGLYAARALSGEAVGVTLIDRKRASINNVSKSS